MLCKVLNNYWELHVTYAHLLNDTDKPEPLVPCGNPIRVGGAPCCRAQCCRSAWPRQAQAG